MAVIKKRHYWGRKEYDTRTGLYKGETRRSTDGSKSDWRGREVESSDTKSPYSMGRNE